MEPTDAELQPAVLIAGESEAKRLTRIGKAGTLVYIGLVVTYALCKLDNFAAMEPNEYGDFLAGVAGPLALFWLVLGYLQQGRELQQNTAALLLQAKEMKLAADQARQLVEVTREELNLSNQALEAAHSAAEESSRPRFHYLKAEEGNSYPFESPYGGATTAIPCVVTFRNVGGAAYDLKIEGASGQAIVDSKPPGFVAQSEEFVVSVTYVLAPDKAKLPTISLHLVSCDRVGKVWSEYWAIEPGLEVAPRTFSVYRIPTISEHEDIDGLKPTKPV